MGKRLGDIVLCCSVFLPLLGRLFFPRVRDKAALSFSASFSDPQMVGTYLVLIYLFYRILRAPSSLIRAFTWPLWPLLALVGAAIATSLMSSFPLFSLWRSVETATVLLWGTLVLVRVREEGTPAVFFTTFYVMSGLMLGSVLAALWLDPKNAWIVEETGVQRLSVQSSFVMMGAYLIGPIAAVLSLAAFVRFVLSWRPQYLLMFGLLLWLAYASRSRTGFVVLVAGLLVCALYVLRIPGRSIMTGLFLLGLTTLVAGVIALSPDFTAALIQSFTRGQDEANIMGLDGRVSIWSLAIKAFHQSPIVGSGYGTYPIWIGASGHFHNMLIELMVTTGLAGLIPACIILAGLMWSFLRLFWSAPPKSIAHQILVLDALLMGTAAVLSNQTTAGAAYYSWELIALVLLLTAIPVILESTKRERRATKDPVTWVDPFAPMAQLGRPAPYPILGRDAHGVREILSPRHRQFDGRHGTEAAHAE